MEAAFEPVHAGHHHVEQDQVRLPGPSKGQRLKPVAGRGNLIVFALQLRLEQARVGRHIIDNEDTGGHSAPNLPYCCTATVAGELMTYRVPPGPAKKRTCPAED